MNSKVAKPTSVLKWVVSMLVPYKRQVVFASLALLVGSLSWLAIGQAIKALVDEGFSTSDSSALNQAMTIMLSLGLLSGVAAYFRFYFMTWLGERVSAEMRRRVYHHLLSLSPQFYESTKTGEVISRFTSDTTVLQNAIGMSLSMALRSSVTLVGGMVLMLVSSWQLTLYVLVAVPVVLVPIKVLGTKVRHFARASQDRVADIGAYVDESLHSIHTVQSYAHEQQDKHRFGERIDEVLVAASSRIRYRALLIASVMALSVCAITAVAWMGVLQVVEGSLSAGELSAFMFYAVVTAGAVATISEVLGEIQRASGAGERLLELLHVEPAIVSPQSPLALPTPCRGCLSIQEVEFAYPSVPEQPILSRFTLEVEPGERVALVGPSGAGKSTLLQLLQRFYEPQQGCIALDGVDISQLDLAKLRCQFALVPQEPTIFADTVLENIRYGRSDASEAQVQAAAVAACADEFIQGFEQGYQTQLGERGVRLSGGQKQRIAIARALLADRPILLLDEATSALDARSELLVQQALERLMANRTCLIIAHRLATVIDADRIVVVDKGQIQAIGTHHELLESSALYRDFAELQLVS